MKPTSWRAPATGVGVLLPVNHMTRNAQNVDPEELRKFERLASHWWDLDGEMKPLHQINPLRLRYVEERAHLTGKRALDVGCGGGILAESMARAGAQVTGIDLAEEALEAARQHAQKTGQRLDYRCVAAEALATEQPGAYDVVTCMEMLEHVPDPSSIVRACAQLVRPGGHVFFSTINRTPKAYLLAVVGAEHLLKLVPQGTHDYAKFIRPSELDEWSRAAGLELREAIGLHYDPLLGRHRLGSGVDVNYLMHAQRPAAA
jgi:2-polyprenyl-6-hydroxyphenyl methylase/3-demethylubiquinone-9 3-methyltransferase